MKEYKFQFQRKVLSDFSTFVSDIEPKPWEGHPQPRGNCLQNLVNNLFVPSCSAIEASVAGPVPFISDPDPRLRF